MGEQTTIFKENHPIATDDSLAAAPTDGVAAVNEPAADDAGGLAWKSLVNDLLQVIVPAIALALIVHFFLAQATVVYGQSMEPNLAQFQRLVVDKLSYRFHPPQRDDIVVLDLPDVDEMLVKRVAGLPGETIAIHEGVIFIDDVAQPDRYPHDMVAYEMEPIILSPLHYFVLGDNRSNSNDSRSFGPIHRDSIMGRVWLRYWPLDQLTVF